MIRVEGLVFDYPGHRALHGVSLHIPAATVTALVGPNGAGKSTLLRCIAGLDQPLAGRITIAGIDVLEHPRQVHKKLGYLSDFFGLYQQLTVRQCLHHAATAQGLTDAQAQERVLTVARQLGLTPKLNALASKLSRGQRQRLAIGQAIVHAPQVLLLDEPASGLDPEARAHLSQLFRQLHAQGMTLLVSSHILSELDEYCTHILSIREGHITSHASLSALAHNPGAAPQVLMGIQLAAPVPHLAQLLQGRQVQRLDPSGRTITTVALPAHDQQARAQLLAELVYNKVPVISYHEVRQSLQENYARSLAATPPDLPLA
ncbi:MAG: ABC transporter ATP-binding protein [Brachymonas sp.]|nr:ABC transporter ATP-binding protein [Brachymonas sp.]